MKPRACIYNRVSTEEQLEGYSIGVQDEVNRAFCKARDWDVAYVFTEEGQSGKNFKGRAKWQDVRGLAERKAFDVLVCHKIDRFSRGTILTSLNELSWLRKYDVTFASATEPLDFTSSYGELMLMMFLWFARHYIVNLSAEVTKGRKARVQAGLANSNHPPFGYVRNEAGEDVPVDALRGVVVGMFEKSAGAATNARGESDTAIAWWLNNQGHRTVAGKLFTRTSVREMLVNRFYIGQVGYAGLAPGEVGERKRNSRRRQSWTAGNHEAMVTQELFDRAQEARRKRHMLRGARPVMPFRVYLLRGLAYCADCGTRLTAGSSNTGRLRYQCLADEKGLVCPCNHRMVYEDVLAPQAEAMIEALQLPTALAALANQITDSSAPQVVTGRPASEITAEMERLDFMFEKGRLPRLAYDRKISVLNEELAAQVTVPAPQTPPTAQEWTAMLDPYKTGDALLRHELLSTMLKAVRIDLRTQTITRWEPEPAYTPLFQAAGV